MVAYAWKPGAWKGGALKLGSWGPEVPTSSAPSPADITVSGNGSPILDGATSAGAGDGTYFGSIVVGGATTAISYTITNPGGTTLNITSVSAPTGFTIADSLGATIAAGASDTLTLRLESAVPGTKQGSVVISSDAPSAGSFDFAIRGVVTEISIPALGGGSGGIRFATLDGAGLGRKNKGLIVFGKKRRS